MTKLKEGESYYLPFWVVLVHLDATPPDPFVKCKLIKLTKTETVGVVDDKTIFTMADTCIVELHIDNVIHDMPIDHLIEKSELTEWASRFAQWFTDYAKQES